MAKILVVCFSQGGNTRRMAEEVAAGAKADGAEVDLKEVEDTTPESLLDYDGIIAGSPTYYGLMCAEMKQLFDESVKFHGELTGKVGGAFSSAANIGGGNETTVLSILQAMLIHGMIVQGSASGDHYGPVAISAPDERALGMCRDLGARVAALADALA